MMGPKNGTIYGSGLMARPRPDLPISVGCEIIIPLECWLNKSLECLAELLHTKDDPNGVLRAENFWLAAPITVGMTSFQHGPEPGAHLGVSLDMCLSRHSDCSLLCWKFSVPLSSKDVQNVFISACPIHLSQHLPYIFNFNNVGGGKNFRKKLSGR